MDIKNRVVIITGASSGIGKAAAYAFVNAGARVVLAARSKDKIETLAGELNGAGKAESGGENLTALAVPTDVTKERQVDSLFEKAAAAFGGVDVLVNNAGRSTSGTIETLNPGHFQSILELNVFGPLFCMRAAIPFMKEHGGVIINVSSMVSFLNIPIIAHYSATKYALNSLSHTARSELSRYNIRVVTVYPGMTQTDLNDNVLRNTGGEKTDAPEMPAMKMDSAGLVARKIVKAAVKEPRDTYMKFGYRFQAFFAKLFPGFLDMVIGKGTMKRREP